MTVPLRAVLPLLLAAFVSSTPQTARRQAPTALTVRTATKSAVELSWEMANAAGTKIVVERKLLGAAWVASKTTAAVPGALPTPSSLAVVTGMSATDSKIDQFATYVYRVRSLGVNSALSAPSNEVTVGPPPVGFSSVISAPAAMQTHDPSQFANQLRMTIDANGDPALAYTTYDRNSDGENDDTDLFVITCNRARYQWNAPAVLDTVGNVVRSGTRMPFAIARDERTGKFGVLYAVGEHELRWATSDDGGTMWKHVVVQRTPVDDAGLSTPAVAMAGGRVFIAYATGDNTVQYRNGPATDLPEKWSGGKAPLLPGTATIRAECVSITLDATGKPAIGYCLDAISGYTTTVAVWRPDAEKAYKITDSNNKQNDDPGLSLSNVGNQLGAVFSGARDEEYFNNHHVWFSKSTDGGVTWSPTVVLVDDGGNTMGPPVSITVNNTGHFAVVANVAGGNNGDVKCGQPKLMRSANGAAWNTCAPDTTGFDVLADPVAPVTTFAANNKLYVAFKTRQAGGGLQPGIILWRER